MPTWVTSARPRSASPGSALVLPALTLNYFGQGALLIGNPKAIENPFYLLAPDWALYPMVALATAATVIASQATISGTYSLTKQAIQLDFLPRMNVMQTSAKAIGQIYIPGANWVLLLVIVAAVIGFGSSTRLASAYGVAVTGTMLVTTILTFFVIRFALGLQPPAVPRRHRLLPLHRCRVLLLEPAQDRGRRLVPARARRRRVRSHDDLAPGPADRDGDAAADRDRAPDVSRFPGRSVRRTAFPARRCSWPATPTRSRAHCCRTSRATRCCTSGSCCSPWSSGRFRGCRRTSGSGSTSSARASTA